MSLKTTVGGGWQAVAFSCLVVLCSCGRPEAELAQLTERFQTALDQLREDESLPGATAAFVLADGRTATVATGFADVEAGIPMSPESRIMSGSIGKTFVAATAIGLADDGMFDLDGSIATWLGSERWFNRLPNAEQITIRMLLTHSSGVSDYVYTEEAVAQFGQAMLSNPDTNVTPVQLIQYILDRDPLFAPGEGFAYTDAGYLLAGLIMERATGSMYHEQLRRRFLVPLSLALTTPSTRIAPGLVAGYQAEDNHFGWPAKITTDGVMEINPAFEWTGGGLVTNAGDLARWAKVLYEGEAMDEPYLDELLDGVPTNPENPEGGQYGLGVFINDDPELGAWYGHGGWFPGYLSVMAYFPARQISVAVQINTDDKGDPGAFVGRMLVPMATAVLRDGSE